MHQVQNQTLITNVSAFPSSNLQLVICFLEEGNNYIRANRENVWEHAQSDREDQHQ